MDMTEAAESRKRKRNDDENDFDLYGQDAEVSEKKPRTSDASALQRANNNLNFVNGGVDQPNQDEREWLIFLVSEKGELQVGIPDSLVLTLIDSTAQ
jgi:hypothetical protein